MTRTVRFLAALMASCCALLAFASLGSAQERLYGADGAVGHNAHLYLLDPSSGAVLQTIGPIGFAVTGLAIDPSTGTLYGSTGGNDTPQGSLITIDKTTGAGTLVGDVIAGDERGIPDITFTPDATLFGWWPGEQDLVRIDKATGAGTVVGDSGLPNTFPTGGGLASNAAGTLFLSVEQEDGPLRTVDRNTGATTPVATMDGTTNNPIAALAFDAAGTLFGVRIDFGMCCPRETDLLTIDTSSGALSVRGPSVDDLDAIVFETPRPAPLAPAPLSGTCRGLKATIVGTPGNDVRTGTPGRDVMLGLEGNDTLSGLAGNDVICGAKGNDTLKGGKGKDTLLGQKGSDKLKGGLGKDKLSGKKGKDRLKGGGGSDKLKGGGGSDKLKGGGGSDKLKGGGGKDVCIGGKANDSASKCEVEKSI